MFDDKTRHNYNFQVLNSTLDTVKELYKSANLKGYLHQLAKAYDTVYHQQE